MSTRSFHPCRLLFSGLVLALLKCCAASAALQSPQPVSFAVVADPRAIGDTWRNALTEIRDMPVNPAPKFSPVGAVLVLGDIDPIRERYADYLKIFANAATRPQFLPVIGNHEFENGGVHFQYERDILIPAISRARRRHKTSCDYILDYRTVRIIAVDAYTDLGSNGVINAEGRKWVEKMVAFAPPAIKHIFVAFHEPAFPRYRHMGDSFDESPAERDAFWQMLMNHRDRVRAVLVGHTHFYSRMRVLDPAGAAANDPNQFPDEAGGIYQVDVGAAGNGEKNIVLHVQVEGPAVRFMALEAAQGSSSLFHVKDEWQIPAK